LIPLYKINFSSINDVGFKFVSYTFLFLTLLVFQALIIHSDMSGQIGSIVVDNVAPFIGLAGLWILVLIGMVVSLFVILETSGYSFENISKKFANNSPKEQSVQNHKIMKKVPKKIAKHKEVVSTEQNLSSVTIKEVGDTAEIKIEESIINTIQPQKQEPIIKQQQIQEDTQRIIEEEKKELKQRQELKKIDKLDKLDIKKEDKEEDKKVDLIKQEDPKPKINNNTKEPIHTNIIVDELEENTKLLEATVDVGDVIIPKNFQLPPTNIFQQAPKESKTKVDEAAIDQKIEDLLEKLRMFKIEGDVVRTYTGPIVTTFEFKPAPNVKVSKILNLQDDLAMALKATTIRIQAPIPGKDVVGIEVPNDSMQTIYIREILESELFCSASSPLTMILGKDIVGKPFITDLKKLPHLLIAGTTGSGKSVGLNSMILSLLYKNSPDNLKLIMIDPKMIEFSIYNDIPHLLTPVIVKPTEAINALANMVAEMERRYVLMADSRTKNIENYNEKSKIQGFEPFPYIVIIIDELADLMMTSGKEVEISIARIAQKARACGIHLIVATQRPSVDVVTGLIKANLPSRISYKVGQKVDSKIILDSMGAESLLGRGDMLFTPPGMSGLVRVHAPWSDEKEIEQVAEFLKDQREASYDVSILKEKNEDGFSAAAKDRSEIGDLDELYEQAKLVVIQDKKSSISYLQRRLKIGYNRAASIIEQLEMTGILSEANAKGNREILV